MALPPHHQLPLGQGHIPEAWRYADATARAAATGLTADDLGRWALQLDDGSLWRLTDDSPVTWEAVGGGTGGGGGAVDSVNGQTGIVALDTDDIPEGATNLYIVAAELAKLATIEDLADVTDPVSVAAAGAVMESDATTAAMSFVIDEDSFASDLATKVPTQQSVKAYVDAAVLGAGSYTNEQAQDTIGGILTDSTSIDFTYDDALNQITASVILEWLQDTVAAILTGGTHIGLTATYQDAGGVIDLALTRTYYDLQVVIDGGGAVIAAGQEVRVRVPYAGVPIAVYAVADQSGSQVVDIWRKAWATVLAGTLPANADTITNAHEPTLSSAVAMEDTSLTDWGSGSGVTFAGGDVLTWHVDSSSTVRQVTWILRIQYS